MYYQIATHGHFSPGSARYEPCTEVVMTCPDPSYQRPRDDLKFEIVSAFSLEAVINLGSLEALLDHLEHTNPEAQS